MKKISGISLIVLIITIIVIIILAGTVILALTNNGIISKANEAKIMSNIDAVKNELVMTKSKILAENKGAYTDIFSLNTGSENIIMDKKVVDENSANYYIINTSVLSLESSYEDYMANPEIQTEVTELREVYFVDDNLNTYYISDSGVIYPSLAVKGPIYASYTDLPQEEGWIPIYTAQQLKKVGNTESGVVISEVGKTFDFTPQSKFVLMKNIDLSSSEWTPLNELKGTFEGNNRTISNMTIVTHSTRMGLFQTNSGVIRNLKMDSVNINCLTSTSNSTTYLGSIVGYNIGSIENCITKGNINMQDVSKYYEIYLGGLVGYISNLNSILTNCKNYININVTRAGISYTGGIVGRAENVKTISSCSNSGNIIAREGPGSYYHVYTGGIAGKITNTETLEKCNNDGNITGILRVGTNNGYLYIAGISGYVTTMTGTTKQILDCYNLGEIKGDADEEKTSGSSYVGGVIAYSGGSKDIVNCYNMGNVSNAIKSANTSGVTAVGGNLLNCYNTGTITGAGKTSGISLLPSTTNTITNCYNTGNINGNGINTAGVNISDYNSAPTITNCYNTGVIKSNASAQYVAGVAIGATLISNTYNTGDIICNAIYVGGVVTNGKATVFTNLYNTGNITVNSTNSFTYVGGIVSNGTAVKKGYNTGKIIASTSSTNSLYVGGIAGSQTASQDRIERVYNTGEVVATVDTGALFIGGIAGTSGRDWNGSGGIISCFNTGKITANGNSTDANIGGISGKDIDANNYYLYNIGQIVNNNTAGGKVGSIFGYQYYRSWGSTYYALWLTGTSPLSIGYTTRTNNTTECSNAQMKTKAKYANFDFTTTGAWTIEEGVTTPYFKDLPKPASVNI